MANKKKQPEVVDKDQHQVSNNDQLIEKDKTTEDIVRAFRVIGQNFIKLSDLFASSVIHIKVAKIKKRVRDASKPKKPLSSYIYFSVAQRNRILKEHPGATNTEVATILGYEWKKLTEKQKQPYINLAKKDKERYDIENTARQTELKKQRPFLKKPGDPDEEEEGEKDVDDNNDSEEEAEEEEEEEEEEVPRAKKQKILPSSSELKKSARNIKDPKKFKDDAAEETTKKTKKGDNQPKSKRSKK